MDILVEVLLYIVISIIEAFFEIKIFRSIRSYLDTTWVKHLFIKESDNWFLVLLKGLLGGIIFFIPIVVTLIILNKFG